MRRREFITLVGGAAATIWPLAARTQQAERMRRVGVLMNIAADDAQAQPRMDAFLHGLQPLGWTVGRNLRIDVRWAAADAGLFRKYDIGRVAAKGTVIRPGPGNPLHSMAATKQVQHVADL